MFVPDVGTDEILQSTTPKQKTGPEFWTGFLFWRRTLQNLVRTNVWHEHQLLVVVMSVAMTMIVAATAAESA